MSSNTPWASARAIEENSEGTLPFPIASKSMSMMERFALGIADAQVQEQLLMSLGESGAFRRPHFTGCAAAERWALG